MAFWITMNNGGKTIEVRDLSVSFQGTTVLSDISFSIENGDFVGVVGPNGSGKTTLLRALLGYLPPQSGSIRLWNTPIARFTQWARIGYLSQSSPAALSGFPVTVEEAVATGILPRLAFPFRISPTQHAMIHDALEQAGISDLRHRLFGRLSGGQRQRVFLARTLVGKPDLLMLDEPTAALDPEFREVFYSILQTLNRQKGATILLVTHDSSTIGLQARKLLYLDRKIVFFGSFEKFCSSTDMTKQFGQYQQHLICHQHNLEKP